MISVALLLSTNVVSLAEKTTRLVRHNLSLMKPSYLSLNHLPVFHILQNHFQKDLFHDLIWPRDEADWLVDLMVLLSTLFKNKCDIPFSPITEDFS